MVTIALNIAKRLFIIACTLVCLPLVLFGQDGLKVQFLDGITNAPIGKVQVMTRSQKSFVSDSKGYLILPNDIIVNNYELIVYKTGYQPDTLLVKSIPQKLYLYPLRQMLQETIISSKQSRVLLKRSRQFVIDYTFIGDNILVAAKDGRQHRLYVINYSGDILIDQPINEITESLYQSSVGECYLVSNSSLHRISVNLISKGIDIDRPRPLSVLQLLQECVLYKDSTYYYKLLNKEAFTVSFCLSKKGANTLIPFRQLTQEDIYLASMDDKRLIQKLLAKGDRKGAAHIKRVGDMLDKNAFKKINVPLFSYEGSLLVIDMDSGNAFFYTKEGVLTKEQDVDFNTDGIVAQTLIQDPVTEIIYALDNKHTVQNLYTVDIENGKFLKDGLIRLEKPFAQKIKVRDDMIYYLWQDDNGTKQQLYIQRNP